LDVERYTAAILEVARTLKVRRIIGFGGVYGELPYNKDRMVSSIYSLPELKDELEPLSVTFSNYHGGASIGSYLCKFAGEAEMEYVSFYAFAPTYSFDSDDHGTNAIRVENDFVAWLNIMQRVDYMLKLGYDLTDLEKRAQKLIDTIDAKVEELDAAAPHLGIKAYMDQLAEGYEEKPFNPLDDVWADELRRLTAKFEDEGD
jgi:proteasome assembly chaperone (PAC2) family protein